MLLYIWFKSRLLFHLNVIYCILILSSFTLTEMNEFTKLLYDECVVNRIDFMKLTIPSILYTVQNTLQYYSISLLSAPVFQVLSQLKILTTAIFSVLLLSRKLSVIQWTSIVFLSGKTSFIYSLIYLLTDFLTYSFIRWCIISPIIPIKW